MPPFDLAAYERARPPGRIGAVVHYRERTASTMDDAREGARALGDGGRGHVYLAGEQTAGRGRRGRTWVSAAAAGLYATYHLCPQQPERVPLLSLAGALAAADAIGEICGLATRLKWPNDVLHDGRKLAGVLAEADHGERLHVFLGIGINVRATRDLPPDVARVATSIERAGAPPPTFEALLAALSAALERWVERAEADPDGLIGELRPRLETLGRRVRLATPAGDVEGHAVDLNERGELVLRSDDGALTAHAAGDLTIA